MIGPCLLLRGWVAWFSHLQTSRSSCARMPVGKAIGPAFPGFPCVTVVTIVVACASPKSRLECERLGKWSSSRQSTLGWAAL